MRPARPDEVPKFGSIWSWHTNGPKYLALRLAAVGPRVFFVGLQLLVTPSRVDDTMTWARDGRVLDEWYCVDEGPA